jgi:hypothetical protein
MRPRSLATALLSSLACFAIAGPASAATVADWQMNEPAGATTMTDSSGSGLSGRIGSGVQTGRSLLGATSYRWSGQNLDGVRPERLITVDSPALNPGTGDFAVTVRLFTGTGDQNIVQKGQATTAGGYFKVDMVQGRASCTFRGSDGLRGISSSETLWDHTWHTVRCERRATGLTIIVDGGVPRTNAGPSGRIENSTSLSIGGKQYCNPPTVGCDYFIGDLDYVRVERLDASTTDTTKPQVAVTAPPNGSYVTYGSNVGLSATASDNVAVAKVEFRVNGTLRCTDSAAPYDCPWTVWTQPGTQNYVRATAYDLAGNSTSHTVSVYTR